MNRTVRNLIRLATIVRTLARRAALPVEPLTEVAPGVAWLLGQMNRSASGGFAPQGRPGQRLAAAFEDLGPTFIKLGQALSTRADLVGDEVAGDLALLRDRLAPFPGSTAAAIVVNELGRPLDQLFATFEPTAVAAASIAQVHRATTPDGRAVAVKVLRPGIEAAFRRDIDLLYWLAGLALRLQPRLARLKPLEVVETFRATVDLEMDLRMEAAAASELAANFRDDPGFKVPSIDWDRTATRVMTLDWVGGVPVDRLDALRAAGFDPNEILRHAAEAFFNQVFRDGFFHADLHPGNLFVDGGGALVAVDFGIMGRLDRRTRLYLADMLMGFLNRDYELVAAVHFDAGYVPADQSRPLFTQAVRAIGEPLHNKPLHEISVGRLLAQLFAVTERFNMATQPQLLLLQKSMLTAEGVGRLLNPAVNMWDLSRPMIEAWMRENRGPEARIAESLAALGSLAARLPELLREGELVLGQLAGGGLQLHPLSLRQLAEEQVRARWRLVRPLLWLAGGGLVMLAIALR